jgi:hypothetical protein
MFHSKAPRLWNGLPEEIRLADSVSLLKSLPKTLLYKEAFNA